MMHCTTTEINSKISWGGWLLPLPWIVGSLCSRLGNVLPPISARKDEMWPSTEMSNKIVKRLETMMKFQYAYEHIIDEGGHSKVLDYFDSVIAFLEKNFKGVN